MNIGGKGEECGRTRKSYHDKTTAAKKSDAVGLIQGIKKGS